jgi:hypothetical protein
MPEYLAPGVYVEETSFRAKSIEGVSTTTTGFVGPTRYGPTDMEPEILTSLGEFERTYGDGQPLGFDEAGSTVTLDNYMWHAARSFFEEGGKRLYVMRVFEPISVSNTGVAAWPIPAPLTANNAVSVRARWPGAAGNRRVRLTLKAGQNVLGSDPASGRLTFSGLQDRDVVLIGDEAASPPNGAFYVAESFFDQNTQQTNWRFRDANGALLMTPLVANPDPRLGDQVRVVTLTVTVYPPAGGPTEVFENMAIDPAHRSFGTPDSFSAVLGADPPNSGSARWLPIVMTLGAALTNGVLVLNALNAVPLPAGRLALLTALQLAAAPAGSIPADQRPTESDLSLDLLLTGGNDGVRPTSDAYRGEAEETTSIKTGLMALEDIEDISIIAAPGSTFGFETGYRNEAATIIGLLISHAERMRYRIAVLDAGDGQSIAAVRAMRARFDSKYAALYFPWLRAQDPITRREISLPPSGFVCGIYARNDINRAVYKAPANEVVNGAIGAELFLNKSQQDVLNPEGVNCFRFFEGRGLRLWGARTISSDPEWKYVNLRRYFIYLERSIDKGTQWAVFEPNGEALWANVRRTIEDFLLNEWQSGALLGDKPEKAYFVRCDRSTMTQNDLDNGRLICLIGVAPLRPAEFVIFRIGQWTADRK